MDENKMKTDPTGIRGTKKREESKKIQQNEKARKSQKALCHIFNTKQKQKRKFCEGRKLIQLMRQTPYKNSEEVELLILK